MFVQYLVYVIFYEVLFTVIFSPLLLLTLLVEKLNLEPGSVLAIIIAIPMLILFFLYLFFLPYLAHQVAKRNIYEETSFKDALSDALNDIRVKLSLLPVIGEFFEIKEK